MKPSLAIAAILGFVGFVTSFGAHVVAVNLPSYAKEVGVGLAMIGVLIAAYDLAEIVAKPLFGALADRAGMKRTMLVGIAVFVLASLLYPFVDPRLLVVVRFLQGVGAAALSAVSLALVGVYFAENRGRAFGIYNAIKGAGYVVSPVIGGAIVLQSSFAAIFYATAAVGVLAFLISTMLPDPQTSEQLSLDDDDDFSLRSLWQVARQPDLLTWYLVIVVNMFFVGILFGFLPVYISSLGYTPLESGIVISVVALAYLLVQPVAGWVADVIEAATTIKIGLVLSALSVIAAPFTQGNSLLALSIVAGIGVGTVWTNSDLLVSRLAKEGRLGATMGVAGSFKEFGDMVGPLLIGALSQLLGLTFGFVICGVLGLLSLVLVFGRHEKRATADSIGPSYTSDEDRKMNG
ncbi:MFS transporter [Mesorhizobium sp. M00.F.Ca.ET.216.01.1.1]|uniref:MFS transporter n=1 Tax=Mesorhizobium sp. M00.F.Ca.ET.216.01.1.1 TaxID=2500528 RepID=UPI000FD8EED2|nr:MFS transporter [Mesorhizobium sp. M00.F.Ca.ET.216.01.1.1]TGQ32423.1 MFS transporter [Mesorhizobium sp. M00.F.Ca.ET.216.01.1.1]TJW15589.1 MAG: MFS transporter [Mesorhizobium sp.]